MKQIPLSQGLFALVDDSDYDELNKYKWCAAKKLNYNNYYAVRSIRLPSGERKNISMHRYLLNINDTNIDIDHWDGDGLNNQRYNIRICTQSQNQQNRRTPSNNKLGLKGVHYVKSRGKYRADIKIPNTKSQKHLGYFSDKTDAARAYNEAAKKYFGEFAKINEL